MVGDAHNDAAVPTLNQYLLVGIDYNNVSLSGQLSSLNLNFSPDPSASEWARGVFSLWIWTKSSVHLSFSTRYHLEARLDSELKWLASLHDSTRGINGENFQHLYFYFQLLSNMLRGQMRAERGIDQRKKFNWNILWMGANISGLKVDTFVSHALSQINVENKFSTLQFSLWVVNKLHKLFQPNFPNTANWTLAGEKNVGHLK